MHSPSVLLGKKRRGSRLVIHREVKVRASLRWVAVILWMGLIFALSAAPSIATPIEPAYDFAFKKLAHVTVYGILILISTSSEAQI